MDEGYEDLDADMNLHRTFFARHFRYFLRGLRRIFREYGSVDAFGAAVRAGESETPSWKLVEEMEKIMRDENNGENCSQCLPVNLDTTALKRINMALRWLVRDDGIVDMGVWKSIPKSKLFIPLDVHAGNTARNLSLLCRRANDTKKRRGSHGNTAHSPPRGSGLLRLCPLRNRSRRIIMTTDSELLRNHLKNCLTY